MFIENHSQQQIYTKLIKTEPIISFTCDRASDAELNENYD